MVSIVPGLVPLVLTPTYFHFRQVLQLMISALLDLVVDLRAGATPERTSFRFKRRANNAAA